MAFNVTGLTDYIKENEKDIISSSLFSAKSISMVKVQVGIKSSEDIEIMETLADFQADNGCAYNTSGTTTFSRRNLAVSKVMIAETLCPEDLEAKFLQRLVQPGSMHDKLPLEKEITDRKIALIAKQLEVAVWQGDTNSGLVNTNKFDGWLKLIDAAGTAVAVTPAASISTTNVRTIFDELYAKIPTAILGADDLVAFCGYDTFRILVTKLTADNLYHYTTDAGAASFEMMYPGTNLKIVGVPGLNADNNAGALASYKNRIIAARTSNLYFGTDLLNEYEKYDVWFSQDDQNIKTLFRFKAGCQIAFPSEIVQYKNI